MAEEKYTWDNIIIDPTSDRAKKAVGKRVYYSQFPNVCLLRANNDDRVLQGILISIDPKNSLGPFIVDGSPYACIIVKKEESYEERAKKWIEDNDLKVGDYVKVIRKAKSNEKGCRIKWDDHMDSYIGKTVCVDDIVEEYGTIFLRFDNSFYNFPYFVLEKTEPLKPEYVPFESKEEFVERYTEVKEGTEFGTFEDNLLQCGMWIKSKDDDDLSQVTVIREYGICIDTMSTIVSWKNLLDDFEFIDDSPCGRLMEEKHE